MPTDHVIPVTEDESIAAVHHEAASEDWVVCCHGFVSDKTGTYEGRCQRAVSEGYNAVRFDFRGCGESDGVFVDQTLGSRVADLRAVLDYFEPPSVVLFGSSFGGKVAFHAAPGDDRVRAIVTRAPVTTNATFDALRETVERTGGHTLDSGDRIDRRFFEDLDRHPFEAVEGALECPVAIVHGGADESIDPADSFRAAAALSVDVMVVKYAGEGHRFTRAAEARLRDQWFRWLDTVRPG